MPPPSDEAPAFPAVPPRAAAAAETPPAARESNGDSFTAHSDDRHAGVAAAACTGRATRARGGPVAAPSGPPPPAAVGDLPEERPRAVETGLGGLFFLVNVALGLDLYGDFTRPRHRGLALPLFDLVALLGRKLVAGHDDDSLWALLDELSGRPDEEPPGHGFTPPVDWTRSGCLAAAISRRRRVADARGRRALALRPLRRLRRVRPRASAVAAVTTVSRPLAGLAAPLRGGPPPPRARVRQCVAPVGAERAHLRHRDASGRVHDAGRPSHRGAHRRARPRSGLAAISRGATCGSTFNERRPRSLPAARVCRRHHGAGAGRGAVGLGGGDAETVPLPRRIRGGAGGARRRSPIRPRGGAARSKPTSRSPPSTCRCARCAAAPGSITRRWCCSSPSA